MKAAVNHNYFKGLSRKDYIQKAHEIIEKEGAQAVSIRRIAKEMGCSSTSMYRYFTSRDELLYYAELPTLRNYINRLNKAGNSWKNIWDVHVGVWDCYSREAFLHSEAYNLLFFNKTDLNLNLAIKEYYSMFPEDIDKSNSIFQEMLQTSGFLSRDMIMCQKCINEKVITPENGIRLNRMVCMLFGGYLKTILDYGINASEINERADLFISDIDEIVHALASDLKGYRTYGQRGL